MEPQETSAWIFDFMGGKGWIPVGAGTSKKVDAGIVLELNTCSCWTGGQ